jgi:tripartite-type tricarboxylate transporter receptor subunit TctC
MNAAGQVAVGQQVIIEDRPGAGSNIAAEAVVRAPPDGYTLLMASNANAINATLYARLNFDFFRDIALVAGAGGSGTVSPRPRRGVVH